MSLTPSTAPAPLIEGDSFLVRDRAAQAISDIGIPTTKTTLENLAVRGQGPPYSIVNGRAVYKRSDLFRWIESRVGLHSAV